MADSGGPISRDSTVWSVHLKASRHCVGTGGARGVIRRRLLSASLIGLLGVLPACTNKLGRQAPRPDDTPAERAAQFNIDHESWRRLGFRWDWTGFPYVSGGQTIQMMRPFDDIVMVQEGGSTLSILDASNGATRWSNELANPLTRFTGLGRVDQKRVLSTSQSEAYILQAETGNIVDRQRFEQLVDTGPVVFNNLAIFGCPNGQIMGHVLTHGVRVWANAAVGSIQVDPIIIGQNAGAITSTGEVIFVSALDGRLVGKNKIYDGISADLATDGTLLFAASLDQSLYAFEPSGALLVWRHRTPYPLTEAPTAYGHGVFCSIGPEGFRALDAGTGEVLWTTEGVSGEVVAVRDGNLIVWDGTDAVIIEPESGAVVDRVTLEGVAMIEADEFEDGNLYVVSESGVVAKFTPSS